MAKLRNYSYNMESSFFLNSIPALPRLRKWDQNRRSGDAEKFTNSESELFPYEAFQNYFYFDVKYIK